MIVPVTQPVWATAEPSRRAGTPILPKEWAASASALGSSRRRGSAAGCGEGRGFARTDGSPAERLLHWHMSVSSHSPVAERSQLEISDANGDREEFERFLDYASRCASEDRLSLRSWLELAETWRITQALRETGGNRSAAARPLGIGRRTLYAKMDKLRIAPTWSVGDP